MFGRAVDGLTLFADSLGPRRDDADSPGALVSPYDMGHLRTALDRERTWMMDQLLTILTLAR
jgi:hypothetical protein